MLTHYRFALRLVLAVGSGLALWLSFPTHNLWWLAPVGVALLAGALYRTSGRAGFVIGLVAGLAFFVPVLSWSGVYVGKLPWFALATLQAFYIAAMGGLVGYAGARLRRDWPLAVVVPLGWVAQEWARSTTPWGGFPWARLAFSQADSPLAIVARYLGAPGVSLAVALIGAQLLLLVLHARRRHWRAATAYGLVGVVWVSLVTTFLHAPVDGTSARVAFVQGNVPHPGLDFNAERRAVLDNHVRGTEELASRSTKDLALVVWPENSSDIDPFRNADAGAQIQRAIDAIKSPLLMGAVLAEPPGQNSNVSLFYTPGGGEPQRYTKVHPVPFAEYIPYRSFFRIFTKEADLAGNFVAGTKLGGFHIQSGGGDFWALPTICFEVAYDDLMRDTVNQPGKAASLLVVQTNNATFGYTAESEQQFAISRIRAIEHGRSVVHVSTVGVSGFIAPDGRVSEKTGLFSADQRIGSPVIRSEQTPSDALGPWPERLAGAAFVLMVLRALRGRRRPPVKVGGHSSPLVKDSTVV